MQIWKKQVLASTTDKFAFASTLAVHIYDKKTFQLIKLLTFADRNITAISWSPLDSNIIAQATSDKILIIWDIDTETVKFKTQLESHVINAEWHRTDPNLLFFIQSNGEFKIMNLETKRLQSVQIGANARPVVLKCHQSRSDIISIGLENGKVFFLKLSN